MASQSKGFGSFEDNSENHLIHKADSSQFLRWDEDIAFNRNIYSPWAYGPEKNEWYYYNRNLFTNVFQYGVSGNLAAEFGLAMLGFPTAGIKIHERASPKFSLALESRLQYFHNPPMGENAKQTDTLFIEPYWVNSFVLAYGNVRENISGSFAILKGLETDFMPSVSFAANKQIAQRWYLNMEIDLVFPSNSTISFLGFGARYFRKKTMWGASISISREEQDQSKEFQRFWGYLFFSIKLNKIPTR